MCTVLLPPGGYPIAVKYITSYHIISYHISSYRIIPYILCHIIYHILYIIFPIVLLLMFPVQPCIYHRRCITSTIDNIVKNDVHIVTRLRDRQPRNRCEISGRGKKMPSSPQCSVRLWGSASLPTKT
jgi:hypothetical protein